MNAISAIMSEWVGPRCSTNELKKMSTSGMTERVRTSGMLSFVFSSFDEALLKMYPDARWPTANDLLSSLLLAREGWKVSNKLYSLRA
jgi:hypothetical protein